MKKALLLLFVICCFISCDSEKKRTMPSVFLDEPQMVDVLLDVQIMENIISFKKNANQKTEYLRKVGYDTIFAHYGINDSIFKENMTYYYEVEPQTLLRVLDSVNTRLARMKN